MAARAVAAWINSRPRLKQGQADDRRGPCPVHNGKDNNFAVESTTGRWFCHSICDRVGDIFTREKILTACDFLTCKKEIYRLVGRTEPRHRRSGTHIHSGIGRLIPRRLCSYPKRLASCLWTACRDLMKSSRFSYRILCAGSLTLLPMWRNNGILYAIATFGRVRTAVNPVSRID